MPIYSIIPYNKMTDIQKARELLIEKDYMVKRQSGASADVMVKFFSDNATIVDRDSTEYKGKDKILEYFSKSQNVPSFVGTPVSSSNGDITVALKFSVLFVTLTFNVIFEFVEDSVLIEKLTVIKL